MSQSVSHSVRPSVQSVRYKSLRKEKEKIEKMKLSPIIQRIQASSNRYFTPPTDVAAAAGGGGDHVIIQKIAHSEMIRDSRFLLTYTYHLLFLLLPLQLLILKFQKNSSKTNSTSLSWRSILLDRSIEKVCYSIFTSDIERTGAIPCQISFCRERGNQAKL